MARALDISSGVDRVIAGADGRATAVFTVTNATAVDLAGAPRATCLDGAEVAVCRVDGPAQRVFKPGITTTLTVILAIADGVAPGDYRVRLDIDPADAATGAQRGPELILRVPQPAIIPVAPHGRLRGIALLIVALVVVAALGGAIALLLKPTPERRAARLAGRWLAALRHGDATELAALASPPHLIDGKVVAARAELAPRYHDFIASPAAAALIAMRLDDGAVAVASVPADLPATAAASAVGLAADALTVVYRDQRSRPRLRVWFRRGPAGPENAGFALDPTP